MRYLEIYINAFCFNYTITSIPSSMLMFAVKFTHASLNATYTTWVLNPNR